MDSDAADSHPPWPKGGGGGCIPCRQREAHVCSGEGPADNWVRRIGDKPCGGGKGFAEDGQVRRIGDKPCGDRKGLAEEGTGQEHR